MFINILFLGNACSQVTQLRNSFILSRQFKNKAKTQTESLKFVLLCFRKTFCFGSKYFPSGTTGFCTNLLFSKLPWEFTALPERLQKFMYWGSKHSPSATVS